jgi:hypothetical protein
MGYRGGRPSGSAFVRRAGLEGLRNHLLYCFGAIFLSKPCKILCMVAL